MFSNLAKYRLIADPIIGSILKLPTHGVGTLDFRFPGKEIQFFLIQRGEHDPMSGYLINLKTKERIYFGYATILCGVFKIDFLGNSYEYFIGIAPQLAGDDTKVTRAFLQMLEKEAFFLLRDHIFGVPNWRFFAWIRKRAMLKRHYAYNPKEIIDAAYSRIEIFS